MGTQYGDDGRTTFALPNMQGRVLVNSGRGPGLSDYPQGSQGGLEKVTLTTNELPSHTHKVNAVTADGNNAAATGNLPANTKKLDKEYSTLTANTLMKSKIIGITGGSQAHENRSPYLVLKNITAVQGVFPQRQ